MRMLCGNFESCGQLRLLLGAMWARFGQGELFESWDEGANE